MSLANLIRSGGQINLQPLNAGISAFRQGNDAAMLHQQRQEAAAQQQELAADDRRFNRGVTLQDIVLKQQAAQRDQQRLDAAIAHQNATRQLQERKLTHAPAKTFSKPFRLRNGATVQRDESTGKIHVLSAGGSSRRAVPDDGRMTISNDGQLIPVKGVPNSDAGDVVMGPGTSHAQPEPAAGIDNNEPLDPEKPDYWIRLAMIQPRLEEYFGPKQKGFHWTPSGTLVPIPGGSQTRLGSETAARVGIAKTSLEGLEEARKVFLSDDYSRFDPRGQFSRYFESGEVGQATKSIRTAVEALLRIQTGAAAPKHEVDNYVSLYSPGAADSPSMIEHKLNLLESLLQNSLQAVSEGRVPEHEARQSHNLVQGLDRQRSAQATPDLSQKSDAELLDMLGK